MGDLNDLYNYFWNPSLYVLAGMESTGIALDTGRLEASSRRATAELEQYKEALRGWAGREINWNSSVQRINFFYSYKSFPIPAVRGTLSAVRINREKKPATDQAAIDWLIRQGSTSPRDRDGLKVLQKYTKAVKLLQFITKLPTHVSPQTGRLHCSLAPETETGRLSSRNPNLQQIPAKADIYGIRKAFIPSPGYKFVVADYSQLELFVLAHFLLKLFNDSSLADDLAAGDLHTETARRCWPAQLRDKTPAEVKNDPELVSLRNAAKTINYAVNYGKTAVGLGAQITDGNGDPIGTDAATALLETYFTAYPGVKKYHEYCIRQAHQEGRVYTLLRRHRELHGINDSEGWRVRAAERRALNTPIQGSAADIVTGAMLRLNTFEMPDLQHSHWFNWDLSRLGARLVLQIHDEFILEVPERNAGKALEIVQETMKNPFRKMKLRVPLQVTAEVGDSWGDCK